MAFDGEARKTGLQDFSRLCGFAASRQLCQRGGAQAKHLQMIGIDVEGFARPGQRGIILSQQTVTECVRCPCRYSAAPIR